MNCGSAFEPGASGLPYYLDCTPLVFVPPDILGALAVWQQQPSRHTCTRRLPPCNPLSPVPTPSPLTRGTDTDKRTFCFSFFQFILEARLLSKKDIFPRARGKQRVFNRRVSLALARAYMDSRQPRFFPINFWVRPVQPVQPVQARPSRLNPPLFWIRVETAGPDLC